MQVQHRLYAHGGRFWQVPEKIEFPKDAKLLTWWRLWVGGQAGYEQVSGVGIKRSVPVRPFQLLKKKLFPKEVRTKFRLSWEPIFQMMESAEGINVHEDPMKSFQVGYKHLKSRVEYVFKCTPMKQDTWGVTYWLLKSRRSPIMKYGTDGDKSKLPVATNGNRARTQQTREMDYGRRVKRRIARRIIPRIIPQGRSIMGRDDRTGRGGGKVRGRVLEEEGSTLQEKEEELEKVHR